MSEKITLSGAMKEEEAKGKGEVGEGEKRENV